MQSVSRPPDSKATCPFWEYNDLRYECGASLHLRFRYAEHPRAIMPCESGCKVPACFPSFARPKSRIRFDRLQEDFVATVSHDLRSPLGFIKGYATSLLRDDIEWDPKTRVEFLTYIDEEADRLSSLIDALLDSSRLQSGTLKMAFQPIRLEALLVDIIQRSKARNYDLNIGLDFKASANKIWGDPVRLMQVFENLITNAAKYASGSDVTIGLDWNADYAHIMVNDTGPGIPEEHLEHIFKRFYRVSQDSGPERGTGLGLYICQEIIHSHRGEIYAESEGKGTTIHIMLPRSQPVQKNVEEYS